MKRMKTTIITISIIIAIIVDILFIIVFSQLVPGIIHSIQNGDFIISGLFIYLMVLLIKLLYSTFIPTVIVNGVVSMIKDEVK